MRPHISTWKEKELDTKFLVRQNWFLIGLTIATWSWIAIKAFSLMK